MGVYYFSLSQRQFFVEEKTALGFILIEIKISTYFIPYQDSSTG
jgi:hypothetical protein